MKFGGKWMWGFGAGTVGTLLILPLGMREMEVHGKDSRIAPSGNAYAMRLSADSIRIDRLPCGNVLAPPAYEVPSGTIADFGWRDGTTLWIRLNGAIRPQDLQPQTHGDFRVELQAGDIPKPHKGGRRLQYASPALAKR